MAPKQHYPEHIWALPAHWLIAAPISVVNHQSLVFLRALISDEENTRALKFRQESDRHRYILAHALKRFVLSTLLGLDPMSLEFSLGEKGKPLCGNIGAPDFNLSHSGDWVLCGVSSISNIGVDVEIESREVSEAVAKYALTTKQLSEVNESANAAQRFMLYWTQKEAVSKALGLGLTIGFDTLDCSGQIGRSGLYCNEQELTVESGFLDGYVVSVAATAPNQMTFYRLSEWTESGFVVSKLKIST